MHKLFLATILLVSSMSFSIAQSKKLTAFTALKARGNVNITLEPSKENKADFTMIKGNAEKLSMEVNADGVLEIKLLSDNSMFNRSNGQANVTLYFVELNQIEATGGSQVNGTESFDSKEMIINVSSGSTVNVRVNAAVYDLNSSSGASLTLTGKGKKASFAASSGASINAVALELEQAEAKSSSGSNITLNATESVDAKASSGSSVRYKGNPSKVKSDAKTSGGSVSKI